MDTPRATGVAARWSSPRARLRAALAAGLLLALALGPGSASANPGLVVTDLNHGLTATQLANSLVGGGVTISNVTYTGTNNAAGSFSGGSGIIGFDSGIVLGSGSVQTADGNDGVEGPNQLDDVTTANATPGDANLTTLAGFSTFDAAVLEFDFVPAESTVEFSYVFSSDEYNEYANSQYNDVFAFYVNGTNCALVPGTTDPVTINTINGGNPLGTDPHHPELFRNNDLNDGGGTIDTEMDGLTVVLTCAASVNPDVTNHMKLAIADGSDDVLDSNVFIEAGSLISGVVVTTSLSGGGQSGANITVPVDTQVTDSATLGGTNAGTAGGTVTYTVYSDNQCTTVVGSGGTKTVAGGVVPDSDAVMFGTAGTFYWQAVYSGDGTHNGATSICTDETVTVTGVTKLASSTATTIHDAAHAAVSAVEVGATVHDFVTVTGQVGAPVPTGDVTLDWFTNGDCSGAAAASSTQALGAGGAVDASAFAFTVNSAGFRAFRATYAGDGTYDGSTATCEPLRVVDANIQISPLSASNPIGTNHTLTGHVNVNDGTGASNAPDGTQIAFSFVSGPGAFVGPSSCTTAGGTGSCSVVITSATAGVTTVRAATTVSVSGVVLVRATGDGKAGDSADATKTWQQPATTTALSPGYWKTKPHQAQTTSLLPVSLGSWSVDTYGKATAVFDAMNCSTAGGGGDAVGCLAGQLLAAKLNVKNGADACIVATIADADTFLSGGVVDGVTGVLYTGPGTYALTAEQRAKAIELKNALAAYNLGLGC